jgi:hypothetical protein
MSAILQWRPPAAVFSVIIRVDGPDRTARQNIHGEHSRQTFTANIHGKHSRQTFTANIQDGAGA